MTCLRLPIMYIPMHQARREDEEEEDQDHQNKANLPFIEFLSIGSFTLQWPYEQMHCT